MTRFVLDCSSIIPWFMEDEATPFTDRIQDSLSENNEAAVPAIWVYEVANVFLISERKKRITPEKTSQLMILLRKLPIHVEEIPTGSILDDIMALARKHHLSSYDASYLELAIRKELSLATLDDDLKKAALKEHVPLLVMYS